MIKVNKIKEEIIEEITQEINNNLPLGDKIPLGRTDNLIVCICGVIDKYKIKR